MRILGFLVLAFIFAVMPFYMLNSVVMPELVQLQEKYNNLDEVAAQVAQQ